MTRAALKLGYALVFILVCTFFAFSQTSDGKALRILVDASKDGGLWWSPQYGTFNPEEHHQGIRVASAMRDRGWQVTELPRGEAINDGSLSGYDVIIIHQPFFRYQEAEQQVYLRAVENGVKLLLMGPDRNGGIHLTFGFRFPLPSRFGAADSWISDPLIAPVDDVEAAWTPTLTARSDALSLANVGQGRHAPSIVTYLPVGSGGVLYIGHSAIIWPTRPMLDHYLDSISQLASGQIERIDWSRKTDRYMKGLAAPALLYPRAADMMPQPSQGGWRFDWEDVPGAIEYELVVTGPHASIPLIRYRSSSSEFGNAPDQQSDRPKTDSYIADLNLRNWSWRVRARGEDGDWGRWSVAGRFSVHPR